MAAKSEYQAQDYSGRTKSWQEQQDITDQMLGSFKKQVDVANQGVEQLKQAHVGGMQALQQRSDRATAGSRGLLGGGRGLALMRQAALERGAAEGGLLSQQAGQMSEAQARAAGAETEYLGEKAKSMQQAALRQQKIGTALTAAKALLTEEAGDQYFTFNAEDRARTANRIRQQLLATESDPAVINAVEQFIQQLQSGQMNVSGVVDV